MSNRHTKRTGYTERQVKSIENMGKRIMKILSARTNLKDSQKAFTNLLSAYDKLGFALDENKAWIEGDEV